MANYKKFIMFSATKNVDTSLTETTTSEGVTTYKSEQDKWDAEVAPYIVAGGKWEKTMIVREATRQLYRGSVLVGLGKAELDRIVALENWKDQFDAAKNLLTGYKKGDAYTAVAATDTIAEGIGKLEAGLNEVQTEIGEKAVADEYITAEAYAALTDDEKTAYTEVTEEGDHKGEYVKAGVSATGIYKEIEDTATATVTKIVAGADADFDTLKEVADWIQNDTTGAAALQTTVAKLDGDENTDGSVAKALKDAKAYTDDKIGALEGSAENVEATSATSPVKVHVESTDGEVDKVEVSVQTQALSTATADADGLATAKDAKDYADAKKTEAINAVVGTDDDTKTANTIKGVKALITENENVTSAALTDHNERLETLEGDATTDGSVAKAVADAKSELIGASTDTKDSSTIYGAKAYADSLVSGKNVSASGDNYVGASAKDNAVTVASNVKNVTETNGTVPTWNADGTEATAKVAPTLSGTANSLMDGSQAMAAVKAYVDSAIAIAKAELENEIEWIEL